MECFLIFIAVIVVVAVVASQAQAKSTQLNEVYRRLADKYRGRFSPAGWMKTPSVRFHHNGAYVLVNIYSTGGRSPKHYTQVHISWPEPKLRLEVYPAGIWGRVGRLMGMEDVRVGPAEFDVEYIVRGSDDDEARNFLSQGVQWQLARIRELLHNGDVYLLLNRGTLLIKKHSLIRDYDDLDKLTELSLDLFEQAMMTRSMGIEFVDDVMAQPIEAAICQICGDDIDGSIVYETQMVFCRRCKTPHHRDCWHYYGACSTYGCQETKYVVPKTASRLSSAGKRSSHKGKRKASEK